METPRGFLAFAIAVILGLNLLIACVLTNAGVPFLTHGRDSRPVGEKKAAPAAPPAVPTPAGAALTAALAGSPSALGDGWTAGPIQERAFGLPFGYGCPEDLPPAAAPTIARSRELSRPDGAGSRLQLWGFGAGQGGRAFAALADAARACSVKVRDGQPDLGVQSMTASAEHAPTVVALSAWRRGDVMGVVTAASPGSEGAATALSGMLDERLDQVLGPVCANQRSSPDEASRNPYHDGYRPYADDVTVSGPQLPSVPDPGSPVPPVPSYPDYPTDPDALTPPSPLVTSAPVEPAEPAAPATERTVSIEKPDPVGPGCGWAFLGEPPPVVDGAKLQSQGYLATLAAQKDLAAQVAAWAQARREYNVAHARYVWDLTLYQAYQSYAAAVARARDYQAEQERKRQQAQAAAAAERRRRAAQTPSPHYPGPPLATPGPGSVGGEGGAAIPSPQPTAAGPTPTTPVPTPSATATPSSTP